MTFTLPSDIVLPVTITCTDYKQFVFELVHEMTGLRVRNPRMADDLSQGVVETDILNELAQVHEKHERVVIRQFETMRVHATPASQDYMAFLGLLMTIVLETYRTHGAEDVIKVALRYSYRRKEFRHEIRPAKHVGPDDDTLKCKGNVPMNASRKASYEHIANGTRLGAISIFAAGYVH